MGTAAMLLPQNAQLLVDAFGARLHDGDCVVDADNQIGYVRLEFGTGRGPDSPDWDGWFSVTPTRGVHPLRGKVSRGNMVRSIRSAS